MTMMTMIVTMMMVMMFLVTMMTMMMVSITEGPDTLEVKQEAMFPVGQGRQHWLLFQCLLPTFTFSQDSMLIAHKLLLR